ncbi:hypothetical protein EDB19DRAFT_2041401 [Suillus lakei]|nr:hypothetical protein EDB19DRAFT_2041401 [Suillus lakei]
MHTGSLARDPGLEVATNVSSAGPFGRVSLARDASDIAQLALPLVQAVAAAIPFAGPPMQTAIGGLLTILQAIDRRSQNKADLDRLASRLHRLGSHICNAPTVQDPFEQYRRDSIIRMLQDISAQVTQLYKRGLAYTSVTQAIIGCSNEIDRYLADYSWSSQMQSQHDINKVLEILQRQRDYVGPTATQLTGAVALGCVTLVDATGHEHPISVSFCTSFQQLNGMFQLLFTHDSIEARIQRRYMEQGEYDLCIDDDKQVTRLTSHEWSPIEAGTKVVMRVVIEQPEETSSSEVDYKCHFCGAVNHIGPKSVLDSFEQHAGCSIDCRVCKRRFQISRGHSSTRRNTRSSNTDSNAMTDAEMCLIRNFHVQQTSLSQIDVRDLVFRAAHSTLMVLSRCPALSGAWSGLLSCSLHADGAFAISRSQEIVRNLVF